MTHATRSHEALAKAEEIRAQLERHVEHMETLKHKLESAERDVELHLLLADLASFLREVPTRNLSETQRLRCKGLRDRVEKVRAA
jgi:ABC-type Fe3+-citrate transport system substrate-binding protein